MHVIEISTVLQFQIMTRKCWLQIVFIVGNNVLQNSINNKDVNTRILILSMA